MVQHHFEHIPQEWANLAHRDHQADIELFASDTVPLDHLVHLISLYHADLAAVYPNRGTPGPDGDMTSVLFYMFDRAGSHSTRNTLALMAAADFFECPLQVDIHTLHRAASFQPLAVLQFMLRRFEEKFDQNPHLVYAGNGDITEWILAAAQRNPDPAVPSYFQYCFQSSTHQGRKMYLEAWDQRATLVN